MIHYEICEDEIQFSVDESVYQWNTVLEALGADVEYGYQCQFSNGIPVSISPK